MLDKLLRLIISNHILENCEFRKPITTEQEKPVVSAMQMAINRPSYRETIKPIVGQLETINNLIKAGNSTERLVKRREQLMSELDAVIPPDPTDKLRTAINLVLAANRMKPNPVHPLDDVYEYIMQTNPSEQEMEKFYEQNLTGGYLTYPIFRLSGGYQLYNNYLLNKLMFY